VTLRHSDDVVARREERLAPPLSADRLLFAQARSICERARGRRVRVRWIELRCLEVARGPRQRELFGPQAFDGRATEGGAAESLADAVDRIRGRFGDRAILSGRMFTGGRGWHDERLDPHMGPIGGPSPEETTFMTVRRKDEIAGLREAGRVVRRCLLEMSQQVRAGVTTARLDEVAARVFRENGARSAPILVYGFPGQTCISVNDEIVHGVLRGACCGTATW